MNIRKLSLIFFLLIIVHLKLSAWTSSNEGVCYTMDTLTVLSTNISYNSSTGMYELTTHIIILENDTLKINPGEIVKFVKETYPFFGIKIYGCILAIGSKDEPIILGDPVYNISNGYIWNGIQFYNTSQNGESVLRNCTIKGAICLYNCGLAGESAIYCENSSPIIDHCTISYMLSDQETGGGCGVSCNGQSYPIISYCKFEFLFNSIAIWCNPWSYYPDTINYPSPLVFGCNFLTSISSFYFGQIYYDIVIYKGGFLDNCYLGVNSYSVDTTLGIPIDTIGDGICNTTSTNGFKRFMDVDGVVNPRDTLLITGINESEIDILPTTSTYLTLNNNYPNPFSENTTIEFEIEIINSFINLAIFDSKGRLVKQLVSNEPYPKGVHKIKWYGEDNTGKKVQEGIYFYKLVSGKQILVKKAIVVK